MSRIKAFTAVVIFTLLTALWAGAADAAAKYPIGEWRYIDRLSKPMENTDWTEVSYDDSGWVTGKGSFGGKDGELKALSGGSVPNVLLHDGVPVYYFRYSFELDELPKADFLKSKVTYDDAVTLYVNGTPIYSANIPSDGYEDGYGADEALGDPDDSDFLINTDLLRIGKNVLSAELHQATRSSSDIFFHVNDLEEDDVSLADIRNSTVCLGVGEDADTVLVTWIGSGDSGKVEEARIEKGLSAPDRGVFKAKKVYVNSYGLSVFRAELKGLTPDRTYCYRVTDTESSDEFTFTLPAEDGPFSFIANGDPQIAGEYDEEPIEIYNRLIEAASEGKAPAFILTLGDQSDAAVDSDLFMRYISNEWSNKVPIAAIVGNHEDDSETFSHFFYMPNMDENTVSTSGDMSGDYWFGKSNTLFICLNSNNHDIDAHGEFMKKAKAAYIEQYGEPKWIVAAFHHSIYSLGDHANEESIIKRREGYPPLFKEIGVDAVFMGHDHTYTRSKPMDGIVYFTLSSSTGTKFYDISDIQVDYAAVTSQEHKPCITRVDVSDATLTVTTYQMQDDGKIEVLDKYEFRKDFTLTMRINDPEMTVNGKTRPIDESGTAPIAMNNRTLVPVRAIIEAMGGTADWDGDTQTVTLSCGDDVVKLQINSLTAWHNGKTEEMDVTPTIINERTLLPIRYIAESFDFNVDWDGGTQTVTITD